MAICESNGLPEIPQPRPAGAVVFHEGAGAPITYHPIALPDGGGPRIEAGRALTMADARALLAALVGDRSGERHWLPATVLAQGDDFLAWYVPGRVRPMWFAGGQGQIRLDVPWPTLVFAATDGAIRLAAVKAQGRPKPTTPLYRAPLMNTYIDGSVCLGSAKVPPLEGMESMPVYEAAIYESCFSHGNDRGNLAYRQHKGQTSDADHVRFWRELAAAGAVRFPSATLVPMQTRLHTFLKLDGARR